jgi:DNA primase
MIETFGLGIATRGIMKGRLVFPIHNADGKLVAYCGRFVGDDRPEDEPKYKQPPHFRKEIELFNWHRVKGDVTRDTPVILVESFFSVVKMYPLYPVISPMGRSLSERQIELLKDGGVSSVIILFDGDDPGRAAVTTVGRQLLAEGFKVSAPVVPEDFKPHRRTPEELAHILERVICTP